MYSSTYRYVVIMIVSVFKKRKPPGDFCLAAVCNLKSLHGLALPVSGVSAAGTLARGSDCSGADGVSGRARISRSPFSLVMTIKRGGGGSLPSISSVTASVSACSSL